MLESPLPQAVDESRGKQQTNQKAQKERMGKEMPTRALQSSDSPGNLEGHAHARGCAGTRKRPETALSRCLCSASKRVGATRSAEARRVVSHLAERG